MVLASMDIIIIIPFAIYVIVANAERGDRQTLDKPGRHTHRNYSRVIQVPRSIWRNDYRSVQALEISRWTLVLAAFLFFAFFGFPEEARQHYRLMYRWIARPSYRLQYVVLAFQQAIACHTVSPQNDE